jgi:D-3-phosphoglycerate dehydrogenase
MAKNLKFIARSGSGLENIDVDFAKSMGVQVFNSPEGNRDAVGEHAVGMLLALFQNLIQGNTEVSNGIWYREGNRGYELKGKTVGIIGYGQMGSAFAERLLGFGCTVLAYDKYKTGFGGENVKEVSLNDIYANADIVSFHVPYTEETHYYFNQEFISQMAKPFYVINTSRGKVLNTADLVAAIKNESVLGACLDVLEFENASFSNDLNEAPESFRYLCNSPQVILSPHVAGWTFESYEKLSQVLLYKVLTADKAGLL